MGEAIARFVFLFVILIIALIESRNIYLRLSGTRSRKYFAGGCPVPLSYEVLLLLVIIGMIVCLIYPSIATMLALFLVAGSAMLSKKIANIYHSKALKQIRLRNSLLFPDVFSAPPPTELESSQGDMIDLYDCYDNAFIGVLPKSDIHKIIERRQSWPGFSPNDLLFDYDDFDHESDEYLSDAFKDLVKPRLLDCHIAELRWVQTGSSGSRNRATQSSTNYTNGS